MTEFVVAEETKHYLPPEVQFIQAITIDINGIGRGKMFSVEKLDDLLNNREEVTHVIDTSGTNSEVPYSITNISDRKNGNVILVPDKSTLKIPPWGKNSNIAMVFCDIYDRTTNLPRDFNPRLMCRNKIKELEEMGFQFLVGVENEFRLFDKVTKKPFISRFCFDEQFMQVTMALPFAQALKERAKKSGISFESFNLEAGLGQIEFPLNASYGVEAIDKVWIFRELSKYVADEFGLIASYMTTPLANQSSNGMHINHSLWIQSGKCLENIFYDPSCGNELSQVGKYWLAGLLTHSKALTAIFCPTINCYRRIISAVGAPTEVTWNYGDRKVAMRVKASDKQEKLNFVENRLPSSACNIYLAVAGMIVAGIDGIKNKLVLPSPEEQKESEQLPKSLSEALKAFQDDEVIVRGLGATFVDWFIKSKMDTDVDILKDVDLTDFSPEGMSKEIEKYLHL